MDNIKIPFNGITEKLSFDKPYLTTTKLMKLNVRSC